VEYIAWYNSARLRGTLDCHSPTDFENDHHRTISQVA